MIPCNRFDRADCDWWPYLLYLNQSVNQIRMRKTTWLLAVLAVVSVIYITDFEYTYPDSDYLNETRSAETTVDLSEQQLDSTCLLYTSDAADE